MKLSLDCLKNLEEDNYDELPAPVFLKGYFKTYAEFLGLDPNEVLLIYEQYRKYLDQNEEKTDIPLKPRKNTGQLILFFLILLVLITLVMLLVIKR